MLRRQWTAYQLRSQTTGTRLSLTFALALMIMLLVGPITPVAAAGPRYFPETGHFVPESFANYWAANGGMTFFGLPVSEVYKDGDLTVQYFERARFERHPQNRDTPYEIMLGQLGRETRGIDPPAPDDDNPRSIYFPETGHNLNTFRPYWTANDGLVRFGLPLTEERLETSAANGRLYTVQYFERARLEWHPESLGTPFEVMLGQLGRERFDVVRRNNRAAQQAAAPQPPPVTAAAPTNESIEMLMWKTVNAERAAAGVPPLAFDPLVAKAAQIHVDDMIANNFLEHYGSDGSRPIDRMRSVGVKVQWASENISMECAKDPATAVKNIHAWMMSEPYAEGLYNHRWNIMYKGYSRIGIAFGVAKNGCWVMAQNFADGEPSPGSLK